MKYRFLIAAIVAFAVCLLFLLIGDGTGRGAGTTGLEHIVLRYFHALTWGLLAVFFLLWHYKIAWRNYVGYAALASYLVFLFVTFL